MSNGSSGRQEKRVFVIMPFSETPLRRQEDLTSFFENNIKRPIEEADLLHAYKVWRSGETFNITDAIVRDLYSADIVIADLSGIQPNPNVMYELGVRLSLCDKPVILIREDNSENRKVFDLSVTYIHEYSPLRYASLEEHLIGKLRRIETGEEAFYSPIRYVLRDEIALAQARGRDVEPADQRRLVLSGVERVADLVAPAMGPDGRLRCN